MTNESFLRLTYFLALAAGLLAAAACAFLLRRPLRRATIRLRHSSLRTLIRRAFPTWLLTAVVLGFLSVSYIDCGHDTYAEIIADRPHLIRKTCDQASRMAYFLAVALLLGGFLLIPVLWAGSRKKQKLSPPPSPAAANPDATG